MKENKIKKSEFKDKIKDITKFINSLDYINKDISETKFNLYNLNNEILNIDINLEPYIKELNKRINKENISIKNEIELYE